MAKNALAIIIPAFKASFLAETMESIAAQTDKNFHLYIGDDASPDDLNTIIDKFKSTIPLTYHRFEKNLGSVSLTKQWDRCVALSADEPYIWLFSDDDLMPADAVHRFYSAIQKADQTFDVYRFNLQAIDEKENKLFTYKEKNPVETNREFIITRLRGKILSSACEFIFSRKSYELNRGFVDFPKAWCSDDASWIVFSERTGICSIPGDPVLWRLSGNNISTTLLGDQDLYIAYKKFVDWLISYFNIRQSDFQFNKNIIRYSYRHIKRLKKRLRFSTLLDFYGILRKHYSFYFSAYYSAAFFLHLMEKRTKAIIHGKLKK